MKIPFRSAAAYGLVLGLAGLVALSPSGTPAALDADAAMPVTPPVAHASGGDAGPPMYPSIVNVRLVRAQAALAAAPTPVDLGHPADAVPFLAAAQTNLQQAWRAEKYVIETTPPPPAGAGGSGAGVTPFASPEDTGGAVLALCHDVVTTGVGLLDANDATLSAQLQTTIQAALNLRDRAVAYIHKIAPPPVGGAGGVKATMSGGAIVSSWGTVMQGVVPLLDDEIQQVKGTRQTHTLLSDSSVAFLKDVRLQTIDTEATINQFWPPTPAG